MMARRAWALAAFAVALRGATIEGVVRDEKDAAVAGATVEVKTGAALVKAVRSDASGHFRIESLEGGNYFLHVTRGASGETTLGPFLLKDHDTKNVEAVVKAGIDFFDEPKFTVAGVTESAYAGGHGSDSVKRSSEALTKAAAALGGAAPATSDAASEAEQHHRSAVSDETEGHPLAAVREFQQAAAIDPSEQNLFDWGTELLVHDAAGAAGEVFGKGIDRFPRSTRMLLGAAVARYSEGNYSEAAKLFYRASDIDPEEPNPYLFLGRAEAAEITSSAAFEERFARFAKLEPGNAEANYYYAASMLMRREDPDTLRRAQALLEKAVKLDPKLAAAYVKLGIVYAGEGDTARATRAFETAAALNPDLEEAHYRLAEAYRAAGQAEKAQAEAEIFRRLSKTSREQVSRDRAGLQRFIVTLR